MQEVLSASSVKRSSLVCLAIGICLVAGVASSDAKLAQMLWDARYHAALAAVLGAIAAIVGLFRINPTGLLLFALVMLSVNFVGLPAVIAVAAVGLVCAVIGRRIARRFGIDDALVSGFIGVFILTGVIGWLLPYEIHTRPVYTVAVTTLLLLERRAVFEILASALRGWTDAVSRSKTSASLALIVAIVSLTTAWLPSIQYDELAYHLMLPAQLVQLGHYRFDVATQVWAIAPWSSDIVHAVVSVLAGAESRGAVNIGWFALACCALWRFGTLIELGDRWKWLGIALYGSQPYISGLLGTAQVENALVPLTIVLAGLSVKIFRDKDSNAPYAIVILAGLFASLKSSQVLVIVPLALLCAPVFFKTESRKLVAAGVVALIFSSSSYVYAWYITGNPVFPLFNGYFKSPFFESINFHDPRWSQGLSWRSLWDLTFDTGKYQEIYVGGAGISALALSPFLLATLLVPALRRTTIWLLIALIGMFGAIQYLRYIAPLLVVTIPLALFSMTRLLAAKIATVAVTCLIVVNLLLIPTSTWVLKNDLLQMQLSSLINRRGVNQEILKTYAFESVVAASVLHAPSEPESVLLADRSRPFTAPFAGHAFAESWYDPDFQESGAVADADLTGERWIEMLERKGIRYVLAKTGVPDRPALAAALLGRASVIMAGPEHTLYCLCGADPIATGSDTLYDSRDFGRRLRPR